MLSKLFTRSLKGGIEKQGSGVVGWLLPLQLWGKVGMGVSLQASPPSPPSPVAGGSSQPANLQHVNGRLAPFRDCVEPILQINSHYNALILKEKKVVS